MSSARTISTTLEIEGLIGQGAPVAMGISGGKDSGALVLALQDYLDSRGHPREMRVLIHAHLGLIEWPESVEWCRKLSAFSGLPLLEVQRKAGGLIERWESRWEANWQRYLNLESLKVILPWSTASMRFCTSELKIDVITRALKARWPQGTIISASGVRAEESFKRTHAAISKLQNKLTRRDHKGLDWHPLLTWTLAEVLAIHEEKGFPLHPAYTVFDASRVSCAYCMLATVLDQMAALDNSGTHPAYKRICLLEIKSAFPFQRGRWLCDLIPQVRERLLPGSGDALALAKKIAAARELAESRLPVSALFVPGKPWPAQRIGRHEAEIIAEVRNQILALYGHQAAESPEAVQESINARVPSVQLQLL